MAYLYATPFSDSSLTSAEIFEISQAISKDYQTSVSHPLAPAQNWQQDELMAISLQISRDYAPNLQSSSTSPASALAPTELREIAKLISSHYSPDAYFLQSDKDNLVLLPVDPENLFVYGSLTDKSLPVFETAKPTGYLPYSALESIVNIEWPFASPAGQQNTASSVGKVSANVMHSQEISDWKFKAGVLRSPSMRFCQPFKSWATPKILPSPFSSPMPSQATKSIGKSASGQNNSFLP